MKRIGGGLIAVLIGIVVIVAAIRGSLGRSSRRPAGVAADARRAVPPAPNKDRWNPPATRLPASLVEIAVTLFEQGFGDPRDCEYREVDLAGQAKTGMSFAPPLPPIHAWVRQAGAENGPRLAVAWNGLVYPVTRVGPVADLEADLRVLLTPSSKTSEAERRRAELNERSHWNPVSHEPIAHLRSASQRELMPAKAILMLRLGRADLAEALWRAGTHQELGKATTKSMSERIWYLDLASAWAWALYDRAARAHAQADDGLALESLKELARLQPLIEAQAAAYGLARPVSLEVRRRELPYLSFLTQLPEFLADQLRRARKADQARPAVSSPPDRRARIAELIRGFDQISRLETLALIPAGPPTDRLVQAVIREGDAAVGPLLDCLEHDDRLTRIVDRELRLSRRWLRVRSVFQIAYTALGEILGTRQFGSASESLSGSSDRLRRQAVAAEIRNYWERTRGVEVVERYFRALADDSATPAQWLDAAEALAQRSDVHGRRGLYMTPLRRGGKLPALRGEPLRGRTNPSLTELLARRARDLDPPDAAPVSNRDVSRANRMAKFLAVWDPSGAQPTLAKRVARSIARFGSDLNTGPAGHGFPAEIARLTLLRVKAGDAAALDDYTAWLRSTAPPDHDLLAVDIFEPLWRYADRPPCVAAATALFDDRASKWLPLCRTRNPVWYGQGGLADIVVSPLLSLAPFRKQVVASLADRTPQGTVRSNAQGKVTIASDRGGWTMSPPWSKADPLRPEPNASMKLRTGDLFAWKLQRIEGLPRFELYWPEPKRDRTIADMTELLGRFGERLRESPERASRDDADPLNQRPGKAELAFPLLNRPAAPEDVAAGRAIFSLAPAQEVRPVSLPAFPVEAQWTALEIHPDDPGLAPFDLSRGKPVAQIKHLQGGRVWQAEEVRKGESWRRYYGFVGRHVIAKLPAAEVDFPSVPNTGWSVVSRDLDGRLVPMDAPGDGRLLNAGPVPAGGPLPVVFTVRNHRGIAAQAPADLVRVGASLALRNGVSIRVFRRPERAEASLEPAPRAGEPHTTWPEVSPRHQPGRYSSAEMKTLGPTEITELFRIDLRDFFELAAGGYRVDVAIEGIRSARGKEAVLSLWFTVGPPGASRS